MHNMYVLRTFSRVINHLVNFVNLCMYTCRLRFSVISLRAVDSQFNGCLAVPTTCFFADEYAGILQFSTAPGLWNDFFLSSETKWVLLGRIDRRRGICNIRVRGTGWINYLLASHPSCWHRPVSRPSGWFSFFSRWPKPHPTPTRGRPKFNRLTL